MYAYINMMIALVYIDPNLSARNPQVDINLKIKITISHLLYMYDIKLYERIRH